MPNLKIHRKTRKQLRNIQEKTLTDVLEGIWNFFFSHCTLWKFPPEAINSMRQPYEIKYITKFRITKTKGKVF